MIGFELLTPGFFNQTMACRDLIHHTRQA
jgi:hypothetical protein